MHPVVTGGAVALLLTSTLAMFDFKPSPRSRLSLLGCSIPRSEQACLRSGKPEHLGERLAANYGKKGMCSKVSTLNFLDFMDLMGLEYSQDKISQQKFSDIGEFESAKRAFIFATVLGHHDGTRLIND
ncbi:hypothetical protein DFH07DRAFT_977239 [Mycena maculata]|uniref:Uncharacterized protein n=1 Tax=Mycena maculata TaxID=230809 RepID=A0AAD7N498_9AGAR|nr:hypothetical protein DFH07DRAFT_977239 [Mycena maculata]